MKKERDPFVVSVGNQIREARQRKHLLVDDVTKDPKVGVKRSTYFDYETGKLEMPMSRFIYVCKKLGLDYYEVMENARKESKK